MAIIRSTSEAARDGRKPVRGLLRRMMTVAAALALTLGLSVGLAPVAQAAICYTDNIRKIDEGGVPWNKKWFLDTYGTTRPDGYFIYYDPSAGGYSSIKWQANSLTADRRGVRFGVSTAWGYGHPWWKNTFWRYVHPC